MAGILLAEKVGIDSKQAEQIYSEIDSITRAARI